MNIAKLQQLKYCQATWQGKECTNVATCTVLLVPKRPQGKKTLNRIHNATVFRCQFHIKTPTNVRKPQLNTIGGLEQSAALRAVTDYLHTLKGKFISSIQHTARRLEVKQVNLNGSVRCLQPVKNIWITVFYDQIKAVEKDETALTQGAAPFKDLD